MTCDQVAPWWHQNDCIVHKCSPLSGIKLSRQLNCAWRMSQAMKLISSVVRLSQASCGKLCFSTKVVSVLCTRAFSSVLHFCTCIPFVPSFFLNVTVRECVSHITRSSCMSSTSTRLKFFQTSDEPAMHIVLFKLTNYQQIGCINV